MAAPHDEHNYQSLDELTPVPEGTAPADFLGGSPAGSSSSVSGPAVVAARPQLLSGHADTLLTYVDAVFDYLRHQPVLASAVLACDVGALFLMLSFFGPWLSYVVLHSTRVDGLAHMAFASSCTSLPRGPLVNSRECRVVDLTGVATSLDFLRSSGGVALAFCFLAIAPAFLGVAATRARYDGEGGGRLHAALPLLKQPRVEGAVVAAAAICELIAWGCYFSNVGDGLGSLGGTNDLLVALADVDPVANPDARLITGWGWGAVLAVIASLLHGYAAAVLATCPSEPTWLCGGAGGSGAGGAGGSSAEGDDVLLDAMMERGSNRESLVSFVEASPEFAAPSGPPSQPPSE